MRANDEKAEDPRGDLTPGEQRVRLARHLPVEPVEQEPLYRLREFDVLERRPLQRVSTELERRPVTERPQAQV